MNGQGDWDAREGAAKARLDAQAVEDWQHPGDAMDDAEAICSDENSVLDDRAHTLEAMRRILTIVVPPPGCRADDRWRAAFGRFVALVHLVAREHSEGMTIRELAAQMRVDERTVRLRMAVVRKALESDARAHTLEAMRRILTIVIPPLGCRDDALYVAAFGRFMALVYIAAPGYAEGMTMKELATQMHVGERTLRLRVAAVRGALDDGK